MAGYKGLTSAEVQERIKQGKQNKASATKTKKTAEILIENIFSVFNIIIFSIVIFLAIFFFIKNDERLLLDSMGVSLVAITNTLIAIIQEIRAKIALDKVNLLLKHHVKIIRDGKEQTIDQSEVVIDDVIIIERGDQVVVDGSILSSNKLEIDESLLTGESNPITKKVNDKVMSGSFCVSGNGIYKAEKVGDESYAQEITKLAKKFKLNLSPLQIRLNFIIKALFSIALFLVLLEIIFSGDGFGNIDFIRKISTILLSLVPQGLVLMSSVTFALGIYRISKIGAIIQKLNAIESFSNVKIVCTDKTGTLTQNKLAVNKVTSLTDKYSTDEIKNFLGTYAKFSSDKNATLRTLEVFEASDASVSDEIPFSSENKMSLLQLAVGSEQLTVILGGYDVLIERSKESDKANSIFEKEGLKVYRNLLFGFETSVKSFEELQNDLSKIQVEPICIVSITDQVRDDVMDAINLFHKHDIEIKILSGDNAAAIQAVAREIGWDIKDSELISGNEIDEVKDEHFFSTIKEKKIFARLKPEHKLRIIKTLRKNKIYTAMIGDGVNDLPAIKESDMGIAMEEGSNITKEVADIVLLKNKFSLLPNIFDEGNKIVNTVSSIAKLFLTKNFLVIYLTLMSLFLLFEFPLTPRRVSLINIFSIGLPSFIIALRNSNVEKMRDFMKDLFSFVMISAAIITIASLIGQVITQKYAVHTPEDIQMVMLFIVIIITAANFLSVTIHKGERNLKLYVLYALSLVGLYSFLAITRSDFVIIRWIKTFYEISHLEYKYVDIALIISIISAVILFIFQIARKKMINKIS
ncbi:MAG TPA: HAD-IC family P-type ATPase [Ignavibacteria bacterium]